MYQAHWGMRESPFRGLPDPKYFYQSPTHEEALARLQFLVDQRRRMGLLAGPSGSGKSLLLEVFGEQCRRSGAAVAKLSLLGVEPEEMLWTILTDWGVWVESTHNIPLLWRAVADRLREYRYQQFCAVALLDDVDQADSETQRHVARLSQCDSSSETRLTLVLAGRNEGIARLDPRLLDLADLRIDVESWEPADTAEYLNTLLTQAGCKSPVFDGSAVSRLHELSRGIPRRAAQLADLALVAGAGRQLQRIVSDVVEEIGQELGVS